MNRIHLYLIKPTRYDDEGYPIQWWRSLIPSNSLACVAGIVDDAIQRNALGDDVEIDVTAIDESNQKVDTSAILADAKRTGDRLLIFLVGVQTNQFPRAVDLARDFRNEGVPVCIGGFHVSGCLSMLRDLPEDLKQAQAMGISFFAGEAEDNRIDEVLRDGVAGDFKPIYNHIKHTPNLAGAPLPMLSKREISRIYSSYSSFDLGRGCPFECSFCTIINVQGRKSRFRTPDDLEKIIRRNAEIGVTKFFMTDDNFARNKHWEMFLDRLIDLKKDGLKFHIAIQVDTLAHKIPNFIEKCHQSGCDQIFIGLENINADSLEAVKKRQNRVEDYRDMFLAWKSHPVIITCGYIIGFPNDTKQSILRDIETIKTNFPIDTLYLNYLTPLPGSEDHKKLYEAGIWMDPDMSKYDLNHRVTHHPTMSDQEWEEAYVEAHRSFYSWDHMHRVIRRMAAMKSNKKRMTVHRLLGYRESVRLESCSKLEAGLWRIRRRRQRRHGMPLENPVIFYPRAWYRSVRIMAQLITTMARLKWFMWKTLRDPKRLDYTDPAIEQAPIARGTDEFLTQTRVTAYAAKRMGQVKQAAAG